MTASKSKQNKINPQAIDVEKSVLGAILLNNEAWDQLTGFLIEEDFYLRQHQIIFAAIAKIAQQLPFDVLTLIDALNKQGTLNEVGGEDYLFNIVNQTPSAANILAYAKIVREHSLLRNLIKMGQSIADLAYFPKDRTASELVDEAEKMVFSMGEKRQVERGPQPIDQIITEATDHIDMLSQQSGDITGISTGFADLDQITSGLQKGDLIIVAGRPSMGKTAFAMNLCENAAIKGEQLVLIFSLEMSSQALAIRMLSSLGRVNQQKCRTGKLKDEDWPRLTSAVSMMSQVKLFIDDSAGLTPGEIRSRARRVARRYGDIGLIVVDYLQLMRGSGNAENRATEVSGISSQLKALAKEMRVPVIALSQLNRGLEQRNDKRPVMSDIRDSGAIEQDADLIAFIYRDEVYDENSEDKGIAEIIIGKQRNGPTGKVRLKFWGEYTRFESLARNT
jgi:replicative DNA helicase